MTTKTRLKALEKMIHKSADDKIIVTLIKDDPDDPNGLIIDPYGPNPRHVTKAEHAAEIEQAEAAGEEVIVVKPQEKDNLD